MTEEERAEEPSRATEPGRSKASMLEPEEIMAILRASVARIAVLTADAPPSELRPTGYRDPWWSTAAVIAHLRACNDVLGGAMLRILREDRPAWRAESPRTWQARSGFHELSFEANIEAIRAGRADLLAALEPLPVAAWDRVALVKVPPGKVYERSTRYYGDWLAQHEGTHVTDLARRQADQSGTA